MPLNSSQLQTTTWASVPARISRCLRAAPGEQKVSGTSISLPMRVEQLQDPGGTPPRGVQTQAIRSTRTQTLGRGGTGRAQGSKGTWVESQGCGFHTMIFTPTPGTSSFPLDYQTDCNVFQSPWAASLLLPTLVPASSLSDAPTITSFCKRKD